MINHIPLSSGLISQLLEILHGLGHGASEQADLDPSSGSTSNGDVEPNLIVGNIKRQRRYEVIVHCPVYLNN